MKTPKRLWHICLCVIVIAGSIGFGARFSWAEKPDLVLKLYAMEFAIEPSETYVAAGPVRIMFFNEGTVAHAIAIEGIEGILVAVPPRETAQVTVYLKKEEYVFYCPRKGHREKGMVGRLKVLKNRL